jgi:hypothetical protein
MEVDNLQRPSSRPLGVAFISSLALKHLWPTLGLTAAIIILEHYKKKPIRTYVVIDKGRCINNVLNK